MNIRAFYPGSFDPVTNGHVNIAERACALFDELVIGVHETPPKKLLFTTEERVRLFQEAVRHLPGVVVTSYQGITVEFAGKIGARVIVRGLRGREDFPEEFQLAERNRLLVPGVETVTLLAKSEYQFLSSTLLKEAHRLSRDISEMVPHHVVLALKEKFKKDELG
jgi:pantetheine-phosphate adenylyltransferase